MRNIRRKRKRKRGRSRRRRRRRRNDYSIGTVPKEWRGAVD